MSDMDWRQAMLNWRIQLRRGTTEAWASANPVLLLAEPGWDTDLQRLKIGDGGTLWDDLPWASLPPDQLNEILVLLENLDDLDDARMTSVAVDVSSDFHVWLYAAIGEEVPTLVAEAIAADPTILEAAEIAADTAVDAKVAGLDIVLRTDYGIPKVFTEGQTGEIFTDARLNGARLTWRDKVTGQGPILGRVHAAILAGGAFFIKHLVTDRITLGNNEWLASKDYSMWDKTVPGNGYLLLTKDANNRIGEIHLDEQMQVKDWALLRQRKRQDVLMKTQLPPVVHIHCTIGQSNAYVFPAPPAIPDLPADIRVWEYDNLGTHLVQVMDNTTLDEFSGAETAREYARTIMPPGEAVLALDIASGGTGFTTTGQNPPPPTYRYNGTDPLAPAGGGTWDRTLTEPPTSRNLYNELITAMLGAKAACEARGATVTFDLITCAFGEADSFVWPAGTGGGLDNTAICSRTRMAAYLDDLVDHVRSDLSAPDLRFVFFAKVPENEATKTGVSKTAADDITAAMRDTPKRKYGTAWIDGRYLEGYPDAAGAIHYSLQGQFLKGRLAVPAYRRARYNADGITPLPPRDIQAKRFGTSVILTWDYPESHVGAFELSFRVDSAGGSTPTWTPVVLTSDPSVLTATITGVAQTSTFGFRMRTTNVIAGVPWSSIWTLEHTA